MIKHSVLVVFIAWTIGCSTNNIKVSDAALSGDPVAMATEGARLNSEGAELINEAESQLAEGREKIREGEDMVREGSDKAAKARAEYRDLAQSVGLASDPDRVEKEAKVLKSSGKQWRSAIDEVEKGNKLIANGNKLIDKGQSNIRLGRRMMERGSALVRNSARTSIEEELLPVPERIQLPES